MSTLREKPESRLGRWYLEGRSSAGELRRAIRLLIVSVVLALAMFGGWWLVATTNREGHHDAELLPLFTLFALVPAIYHLIWARYLRSKGR